MGASGTHNKPPKRRAEAAAEAVVRITDPSPSSLRSAAAVHLTLLPPSVIAIPSVSIRVEPPRIHHPLPPSLPLPRSLVPLNPPEPHGLRADPVVHTLARRSVREERRGEEGGKGGEVIVLRGVFVQKLSSLPFLPLSLSPTGGERYHRPSRCVLQVHS